MAKKRKILTVMVCVAMFATVLAAAVHASESVIFDDQFDDPTLGPEWVISPGKGWYSLTDNPGYLRYIIDAYGWGGRCYTPTAYSSIFWRPVGSHNSDNLQYASSGANKQPQHAFFH